MTRMMMTLVMAFAVVCGCGAQRRRALLVGISCYDRTATQWNSIHGTNDVALMKAALRKNGFYDITELRNGSATYDGIRSALERLVATTEDGDVVYVHLSGHGQPVEDYDGDEKGKDGWDEAFVPYDAQKTYRKGTYEGEHHITDDILNGFVERLRTKAGNGGMVYVSIDACHAGDSYRGEDDGGAEPAEDIDALIAGGAAVDDDPAAWSTVARGSADGFSRSGRVYSASNVTVSEMNVIRRSRKKADVVMMESCLSTQRSYELKIKMNGRDFYCGPLSYVIYKVLTDGNTGLTRDAGWVKSVKEEYRKVLPKNNPQKLVIETSVW